MDGWRLGLLWVLCCGCGPELVDGSHGEDDSTGGDATGSATASASASTSAPTTTATSSSSSTGTTTDETGTSATATWTEDGPAPPEGDGESNDGSDCTCCGSSLHVVLGGVVGSEFAVTLSLAGTQPIAIGCPAGTAEGVADGTDIECGDGELTIRIDGLTESFVAGDWTVTVDDGAPVVAHSDCTFDLCDCNCQPTTCELPVDPPGVDDG